MTLVALFGPRERGTLARAILPLVRLALGGLSLLAVVFASGGASAQVDSQGNWYPPYDHGHEPKPKVTLRPIGQCPLLTLDPPEPECKPYYSVRRSVRWAPILWAGTLFTVSYGLSLDVAFNNGFSSGSEYLVLPLVGPFIAATKVNGCGFRRPTLKEALREDCNTDLPAFGLLIDGVVQVFAATLAPVGVAWRRPGEVSTSGQAGGAWAVGAFDSGSTSTSTPTIDSDSEEADKVVPLRSLAPRLLVPPTRYRPRPPPSVDHRSRSRSSDSESTPSRTPPLRDPT